MTISIVDAGERFSACDLRESPFLQRYAVTVYACPSCAFQVTFSTNDLYRHLGVAFTNLPTAVASIIDRFRRVHEVIGLEYLDFLCPGCGLAVGVCYDAEVLCGARWEAYGYRLLSVLECDGAELAVAPEPAHRR